MPEDRPGRSWGPEARPAMNGTALQHWRAAHDLSQAELAVMLDVPVNTLARWERGEVAIRHPRILDLALHAIALSLEVSATRRATRS
jgi:transcriptional regulator with XRE-family HTH domain